MKKIVLKELKKKVKEGDELNNDHYNGESGVYLVNGLVIGVPSNPLGWSPWDLFSGVLGLETENLVEDDTPRSELIGVDQTKDRTSSGVQETPPPSLPESIPGSMHIQYSKESSKNMLELARILTREKDK